jgi:hypothetical protein
MNPRRNSAYVKYVATAIPLFAFLVALLALACATMIGGCTPSQFRSHRSAQRGQGVDCCGGEEREKMTNYEKSVSAMSTPTSIDSLTAHKIAAQTRRPFGNDRVGSILTVGGIIRTLFMF